VDLSPFLLRTVEPAVESAAGKVIALRRLGKRICIEEAGFADAAFDDCRRLH
jgi:hypothetical protein